MPALEFHPDVTFEIQESYLWYDSKSKGLGDDFLNELESAFLSIQDMPETWPVYSKFFRRYLLSKFPYGIIYKAKSNHIFIIAVMHLSRKPGYWQTRI